MHGLIPPRPGSSSLVEVPISIDPKGARKLHLNGSYTNVKTAPWEYTCTLKSTKSDLEWRFDPDPERIILGNKANNLVVPSRGGQVSYATTRQIGPLEVTGLFRSRWDHFSFHSFVLNHQAEAMYQGAALRFVYPERDLDYDILINVLTPGIELHGKTGEIVEYKFTAEIAGDHTAINTTELSRLAQLDLPMDIGWINVENAAKIAFQKFGSITGVGLNTSRNQSVRGGETPAEEEDVS